MSATERYEDDIRKAIQLYRIAKEDGSLEATKAMLGAGIGSGILPDGNPLGLHLVMFQPTLMGQGTLEQQAKWLGGAWNLDFIGKEPSLDLGPKPVFVDTFISLLMSRNLRSDGIGPRNFHQRIGDHGHLRSKDPRVCVALAHPDGL